MSFMSYSYLIVGGTFCDTLLLLPVEISVYFIELVLLPIPALLLQLTAGLLGYTLPVLVLKYIILV